MDRDSHRTDVPDRDDDRHGESRADTQTATAGREQQQDNDDAPKSPAERAHSRRFRVVAIGAGGLLAVLLVVGGVLYWLNARHYATTTDAQIDGNVSQMASQVAGRVTGLLVSDNEHVVAGQRLIEIDPRDYQAKLDQALGQQASATAQVQQATAQLGVQQANLDQAQANVVVAQADLTQAQQDHDRLHRVTAGAISKQQLDQADAAFRSQTAKLAAAQQAVEGAHAQMQATKAQLTAAQASLRQAEAGVKTAKLQLSYTTIVAPVAGRVTHRTVNVGDYVQPGQALFALVQDELWVAANFKETELARMKPGQPVTIQVDAVPGVTLHGTVDSFEAGTGSVFSALPAENATGNWVKVVQRLPVKITFDGDGYHRYLLAPGMSVEPSVKVR